MRLFYIFLLAFLGTACGASDNNDNPFVQKKVIGTSSTQVGLWYTPLYVNIEKYKWQEGFGVGAVRHLMGNIDGDMARRDDAVVWVPQTGEFYAMLSTGTSFGPTMSYWGRGPVNATEAFIADVNNDQMADAVLFTNGTWYVGCSNGTTFTSCKYPHLNYFDSFDDIWIYGHGYNPGEKYYDRQMMADVNGDGKADAIVYFGKEGTPLTGSWWIATAGTLQFHAPAAPAITGHGAGSKWQGMADVNGDHLADAVVFFDTVEMPGFWYVSLASSSGYAGATMWAGWHGIGSDRQMLNDTNGDGKSDAVAFFHGKDCCLWPGGPTESYSGGNCWLDPKHNRGDWWRALSNGNGAFVTPSEAESQHEGRVSVEARQPWKLSHGGGATTTILADPYGSGKAVPIAVSNINGEWRVMPPAVDRYSPAIVNTWEAWRIKHLPIRESGALHQYDSGDIEVIDEHLDLFSTSGIDFLLLDATNGVTADYNNVKDRMLALCSRIAAKRALGQPVPKYAFAIRGVTPHMIETESIIVWNEFVNNPTCGYSNYYHLEGKPLLVAYTETFLQRRKWECTNRTIAPSRFYTVRWIQDTLSGFPGFNSFDESCPIGDEPTDIKFNPPSYRWGDYFGWGYIHGTLDVPYTHMQTKVVMPGWNNHAGDPSLYVQRKLPTTPVSLFYQAWGWDRILPTEMRPDIVLINSWNDYGEETAIAKTNTTQLGQYSCASIAPSHYQHSEQWDSPDQYWKITRCNLGFTADCP
ncbi:MAG: hypothetical protein JNJ46_11990 [Myxococcales bacterium]|nr:hypothetical protein [Myxococcales bacterium]